MRSITRNPSLSGRLLQHIVITGLFLLAIAGCSDLLQPNAINEHNQALLLQIPPWNPNPNSDLPSTSGHVGEVLALKEVAARPSRVLSVGADGNVISWDLASGAGHLVKQMGETMQLAAFGERRSLVAWVSGSSVHVACVDTGCQGRWDLSNRLQTRFTTLAFHDDDSAILIGGADGRIYRWRFLIEAVAQTLKDRDRSLERYIVHQSAITALQPLRSGRAFFSADWNGLLYGWLAYTADDQGGTYDRNLFGGRFFGEAGSYLPAGRIPDRGITSIALSDDSSRLALGTEDGFVEIWEVRGFTMIARSSLHVGRVVSVSLNDDGTRVVSLGRDGKVRACDIVPDPTFGIAPLATRARYTPAYSEEMKSARKLFFLSSGKVLISTDSGQLGELALASQVAPPQLLQPTPTPASSMIGKDSDY